MDPSADAGSFRDPGGRVYVVDGRVFRTVMPSASPDFEFVRGTGLIEKLIDRGWLIAESPGDPAALGTAAAGAAHVLEHPRLPLISYPYEWPFPALKAAALLHLDVHLEALEHGVTLADASAYNVQFRGPKPVFIDSLAFRRYEDGEFWMGHRQFCEQFLNPLLLRSLTGTPHNSWYRGSLEGISAQELARVLPLRGKLSFNVLTHVVLQARFQSRQGHHTDAEHVVRKRRLPRDAFRQMLSSLRSWVARLQPRGGSKTVWQDYASDNSYSSEEARMKHDMVGAFVKSSVPAMLWDIGCNTGDYSKTALDSGAEFVVGFDFDQGALDIAFQRAQNEEMNLLPLFLDVANPSPSQGWAQRERSGLEQRAAADGLLALALVHHLAIAKNVPLDQVTQWLVSLAPSGLIEFVPKSDPMVKALLRLREDIFPNYDINAFRVELERISRIERTEVVSESGRTLFWYQRA